MKIIDIIKPFGWIHEIFHWIPAKILAANVKAYPDHTVWELQDKQWKNVVITIGLLVAGLVILGIVGRKVAKERLDKGWLEIALLYLGSSLWDVVDLIYFAKNKKWMDNPKKWK
jgi:hypothetical protein